MTRTKNVFEKRYGPRSVTLPDGSTMTHANLNVYTTDLAENGIDLAKLYDYDLIVLDLGLLDINGHEVLRQLRGRKIEPPILILSGSAEVDDEIKGFGADDYMVEPFLREELVERITRSFVVLKAAHRQSSVLTRLK